MGINEENELEKDNNKENINIIKEQPKFNEQEGKNEKNNEEKKEEEKIVEEIEENAKNIITEDKNNYSPVIVLPLYSSMEPEEQMKIYQEHKGKRMIVVSTNVAETSLTIPNVRYVVDSGRVNKRIYKSER